MLQRLLTWLITPATTKKVPIVPTDMPPEYEPIKKMLLALGETTPLSEISLAARKQKQSILSPAGRKRKCYFTIAQAAYHLKCSRYAFYSAIRDGRLTATKFPKRGYCIERADLAQYASTMKKHRTK